MDCYIQQLQENDCSFACLKMILAYYSKNKEFLYLKQNLDRSNFSLWDIIEEAKRYGLDIQGVKIVELTYDQKIEKKPFLALFKTPTGVGHLVFVRKIRRNRLLIYDPQHGKYWMKRRDFLEKWTGVYVKFIGYVPTKFKSENLTLFKRNGVIVGNIIRSLSSVFLMVGFYFIDESSFFSLPLLFVVLFVISITISNVFIKRSSAKFDEILATALYTPENKNFSQKYESLLKYKTMVFTSPSVLITNILVPLFFIIVTSINNIYNLGFFVVLLVITFIDYYIFERMKIKYSRKIEDLEARLSKENITQFEFEENFKKLNRNSDKFSTFLLLRRYIIGFIIFALTFVLMAISKQISLNYLIFHYLVYELVYQSLIKVVSYSSSNEEFKLLKAKFVSFLNGSK